MIRGQARFQTANSIVGRTGALQFRNIHHNEIHTGPLVAHWPMVATTGRRGPAKHRHGAAEQARRGESGESGESLNSPSPDACTACTTSIAPVLSAAFSSPSPPFTPFVQCDLQTGSGFFRSSSSKQTLKTFHSFHSFPLRQAPYPSVTASLPDFSISQRVLLGQHCQRNTTNLPNFRGWIIHSFRCQLGITLAQFVETVSQSDF